MQINGLGTMTREQLKFEVEQGARFTLYEYCVSALVVTVRHSTDIYYVRPNENHILKGLPWTILTLFAGWWGFPWGPIYTVGVLWKNLRGGEDVTAQVLLDLNVGYVDLAAPIQQ